MLNGFNHVAILTEDLDRLEAFYRDVFEVDDVHDMDSGGMHHRFFRVGPSSVLHAFRSDEVPAPSPIFERGRVDHLALDVTEREEFDRLVRRLVDAGACTGETTDFGFLVSASFQDPDGLFCELCWMRPDTTLADVVEPW